MCLAVPGQLLDVSGDDPLDRTGRVSFGGAVKQVSLACTPEAQPGDYIVVHVGFAIAVLDEQEAKRTLAHLRDLGALDENEEPPP